MKRIYKMFKECGWRQGNHGPFWVKSEKRKKEFENIGYTAIEEKRLQDKTKEISD